MKKLPAFLRFKTSLSLRYHILAINLSISPYRSKGTSVYTPAHSSATDKNILQGFFVKQKACPTAIGAG